MNLAGRGLADKADGIVHVNFNQDYSCISVGTRRGYKIYNCDPFGKCYSKADGGIGIVEMLFCTSLVALVGLGDSPTHSPRRLTIVNTKRQTTICELTFPTAVLAVKLNRRRLIVILEEQIYVYDISNMKLLHTIETAPNPTAICALSSSSENCFIAYPSPTPATGGGSPGKATTNTAPHSGDVVIFDCLTLQPTTLIHAHKSSLSALALSSDGTLLATASDKGTVIRVFRVDGGVKLYQFRRGTYPAKIYNVTFNAAGTLLCVSSDTDTVHIFRLGIPGEEGQGPNGEPSGGFDAFLDNKRRSGSLGSVFRKSAQSIGRHASNSLGGYLPPALSEMWDPQRDFAYLKLPTGKLKSIVGMSGVSEQIMVVTSEGYFYTYKIDLARGGECVLLKSWSLLDEGEEMENSTATDA
ncbi:autophagy protein [Saitoella coloradoensis]